MPRRTLTVSEARKNLPALVREVGQGGEPVLVGPRGKPTAVLVNPEEYERLVRIAGSAVSEGGWDRIRLEIVGSVEDLDREMLTLRKERQALLDAFDLDDGPRKPRSPRPARKSHRTSKRA